MYYTPFTRGSKHDANMKQTKSTRRARVYWMRLLYVCFMYASSCKRVIRRIAILTVISNVLW